MEKYDIVNGLAREFGLRRYLEICTSTTGLKFQYVDPAHFDAYHRLMYRCPPGHDDGFEITRRTEAETSHALVAELHATLPAAERYDIILVDPHHTYRASRLDLLGALCLLAPHGIMVVHDCNPTDPSIVQPQFQPGSWCGVTYQAYVDFLLGGRLAGHCTVDADFGCGVVFNEAASVPAPWRGRHPPPRLALDWAEAADDDSRRYDLFDRHRAALLNLVTPEHFRAVHPLCQEGLLLEVAGMVRPGGRMFLARLVEALGGPRGRTYNRVSSAIPLAPDGVEIDWHGTPVRLWRTRTGLAANSPVEVVCAEV